MSAVELLGFRERVPVRVDEKNRALPPEGLPFALEWELAQAVREAYKKQHPNQLILAIPANDGYEENGMYIPLYYLQVRQETYGTQQGVKAPQAYGSMRFPRAASPSLK